MAADSRGVDSAPHPRRHPCRAVAQRTPEPATVRRGRPGTRFATDALPLLRLPRGLAGGVRAVRAGQLRRRDRRSDRRACAGRTGSMPHCNSSWSTRIRSPRDRSSTSNPDMCWPRCGACCRSCTNASGTSSPARTPTSRRRPWCGSRCATTWFRAEPRISSWPNCGSPRASIPVADGCRAARPASRGISRQARRRSAPTPRRVCSRCRKCPTPSRISKAEPGAGRWSATLGEQLGADRAVGAPCR